MILLEKRHYRKCRICSFWTESYGKYRTNEKAIFEHKIRQGVSLRELAKYLEYSCNFKVSHNLIRNHIKNCMSEDVQLQRSAEIETKKQNSTLKSKLKSLIFRPKEEFSECKHLSTFSWFQDGLVWTKCNQCNKVLGKHDPDQKSRNSKEKNWVMLEALMVEK